MKDMQPRQRGLVHFDSSPRGAQIWIDGQVLINPDTEESIKTPATVALIEGRRDFIMRLEGHDDVTGYVDVYAGSKVDIHRNFDVGTPGGGEKPEPQIWLEGQDKSMSKSSNVKILGVGTVNVTSVPLGAQIFIDGEPLMGENGQIRKTPIILTNVPEGYRRFTYLLDGYYKENVIAEVIVGQVTDAGAMLSPKVKPGT